MADDQRGWWRVAWVSVAGQSWGDVIGKREAERIANLRRRQGCQQIEIFWSPCNG